MSRFAVLRRPLVCLPLGCFALGIGVLAAMPTTAPPQAAAVWVYSTAICARAGDASDCQTVEVPARPQFPTAQACSAHRDVDLAAQDNPRLMGTCRRQLEA